MMLQADHQPCLKICLCGSLHIELDGARLDEILDHKYRGALLAYLALHPGKIHKNHHIITELWPPDATPKLNNLSVVVNDTRDALQSWGSRLVSRNSTLRLESAGIDIDVVAFDVALQARDPQLLAVTLERCSRPLLESWGGYDRPWVRIARETHERRCREAHRWLASHAISDGDFQAAIHQLELLRERGDRAARAHHSVMERLIVAKLFVMAAQLYEEYRDHLDACYEGLLPEPKLTELYARIPHKPLHFAVKSLPVTTAPEPITGAMALETPYYIERAADVAFHTAMRRHDSIVRIEGSRQTGKTSLLARGLEAARMDGTAVVSVDFQGLDVSDLISSESLVKAIAHAIYGQLGLAVSPAQHWDTLVAPKTNFHSYVRDEVVRKSETPVVCAIDEADRIFDRDYRSDIFGLFRSWHNARALDPHTPWNRFTLVMAYASEAHLLIPELNESPFNVGTQIPLQDFTVEEVADLNRRHGQPLGDRAELERLMAVVGGHPYLVQRSLVEIKMHNADVAYIEAEADREIGIFSDHLNRITRLTSRDPQIAQAVRALIAGAAIRDSVVFSRLRSAGVLAGNSLAEARFRCALYEQHFRRHPL